ncbi:DNA-directed RNA polymerase III subunit RPC10-like [Benincasa hispida]|uniref:DNA-directed RNA polymerase III subunit RPC10-like n=1 Tax=Benincasa hispida TaxID=102211 RepID=UPI00190028F5|nr:DNA-directed RNA polymerase III subunit RPC10-like [Benincasa hispida]
MEFCPTCGNMLQFELPNMGKSSRFFCPTCPYVSYLENRVKIKRKQHLVKKELEPIISDDDMKNAAQTEATCPNCAFGKAAFIQIQLRSADEPATTFYKCMNENCRHNWRED